MLLVVVENSSVIVIPVELLRQIFRQQSTVEERASHIAHKREAHGSEWLWWRDIRVVLDSKIA